MRPSSIIRIIRTKYWQLYINHTFLREQAKQTVVDMTIHDTLFYQMATAEKITLSEEEEQYLANDQQDFWSDLTEEQRARLGVDEKTIDASMRKMALAQKYQSILAEMEQVDCEDYSIGGTEYEKLLAQHICELDETTWDRVPFGQHHGRSLNKEGKTEIFHCVKQDMRRYVKKAFAAGRI